MTEEEIVAEVVESDWENSCDPKKIKNMYNGINAQNLKKVAWIHISTSSRRELLSDLTKANAYLNFNFH